MTSTRWAPSAALYCRFDALAADWEDEGSEAALDKNPRRAHYLSQMASRAREIGQEIAWGVWHDHLRRLGLSR